MYLHSNKDNNWEIGKKLGLEGEALSLFRFALCEVELEVEVDTNTGNAKILKIIE
jgi:hypothetical protein